jgi:hypothetical protein
MEKGNPCGLCIFGERSFSMSRTATREAQRAVGCLRAYVGIWGGKSWQKVGMSRLVVFPEDTQMVRLVVLSDKG